MLCVCVGFLLNIICNLEYRFYVYRGIVNYINSLDYKEGILVSV